MKFLLFFLFSIVAARAQLDLTSAPYGALFRPNGVPAIVSGSSIVWLDATVSTSMYTNTNSTVQAVADDSVGRFVAAWKDRSPAGTNHVYMDTPAASERRPALSNSWINGLPALIFASPAITTEERSWLQSLTNNIILGQTGITVFVVAKHSTAGTGNTVDTLFSEAALWQQNRRSSSTNMEIAGVNVFTNYFENVAYTWAAFLYNATDATRTNFQIWRNGVGPIVNSGILSFFPTRTGFSIAKVAGYGASTVQDNCWHGSIGEVIVFPFKLNVTDFQDVNRYLTNKWGTGNLSAN